MKSSKFLMLILFAVMCCTGYAQESAPSQLKRPLFVIKVDKKVLELEDANSEKFDLGQIDAAFIESVLVYKNEKATEKYGEKGQNGVVVVSIKKFEMLSKDLQAIFSEFAKEEGVNYQR